MCVGSERLSCVQEHLATSVFIIEDVFPSKLTHHEQMHILNISHLQHIQALLCSIFVYSHCISEAFEAIYYVFFFIVFFCCCCFFAFEAVAVYSPSPVFNAVNTPSGHVSFVCVYTTL